MASRLVQRLLDCWRECAPGQLADAPELNAVLCMEAILTSANLLIDSHPQLLAGPGTIATLLLVCHSSVRRQTTLTPLSQPS